MTPNIVPRRRAAGTPSGGQFATTSHGEPAVQLSGPAGQVEAADRDNPPSLWGGFTPPTGSMSGVDPAARSALLDETAPTVTDPDGRYPVVTGPRYDSGRSRTAAEIARLLRADLKAAQESRALPPTATFAVRSDSFAGGQSVRVEIQNLPDSETLDDHPDYPNRPSTAARELERTVRRMANAYNRDASDRGSDVYDVHYYALVSIETESGRRTRGRLAAAERSRVN